MDFQQAGPCILIGLISIFAKTFSKMTFAPFMQYYFKNKPELYHSILELEKKIKRPLFAKLKNDNRQVDFYSWITEMRFGLYFDRHCDEVKYDFLLEGQRPDWTIKKNCQKMIAEVLRLNVEETKLNEIYEDNERIRIHNEQNPNNLWIKGGQTFSGSSQYLYNHQYKIKKKEEKYRNLVLKHDIPYIICTEPSIDTFVNELDLHDFLIGSLFGGKMSGFFYQDEDFGRNVTGVLLHTYFGQYVYFKNEIAHNKLNEENQQFFETILYKP